MGKLVVFEGCDCSGKETQTKLLTSRLNKEGIKTKTISFPVYDSPTGRIVGACYLGKEKMCKEYLVSGTSFFDDATLVDPLVSMAYYAADRRYNMDMINSALLSNDLVLLDRYVYSNMAHQGSKIDDIAKRYEMFKKCELLEFDYFELPKPDKVYLLYASVDATQKLRNNRSESLDQNERNIPYLRKSEEVYLQLADYYNFDVINCSIGNEMRSIDDIHKEVYSKILKLIKK